MAVFINRASLTYNGGSVFSDAYTDETPEMLSVSYNAVSKSYNAGDTVTYVISLINNSSSPLDNLTVTDNLGEYPSEKGTAVPLNCRENTVLYYVNGLLQPPPRVASDDALTISGISIPAGGTAAIIYQAALNAHASPATDGEIINTAVISGSALPFPVTVSEIITAADEARLTIAKSVSPPSEENNGSMTFTFRIRNFGNTEASSSAEASVSDILSPLPEKISVQCDSVEWTQGVDYSYDSSGGVFTTSPGRITVPAASFMQDENSGEYITLPGESIITVKCGD